MSNAQAAGRGPQTASLGLQVADRSPESLDRLTITGLRFAVCSGVRTPGVVESGMIRQRKRLYYVE